MRAEKRSSNRVHLVVVWKPCHYGIMLQRLNSTKTSEIHTRTSLVDEVKAHDRTSECEKYARLTVKMHKVGKGAITCRWWGLIETVRDYTVPRNTEFWYPYGAGEISKLNSWITSYVIPERVLVRNEILFLLKTKLMTSSWETYRIFFFDTLNRFEQANIK